MANVLLLDEAREDLRDLDNAVQKLVLKALVKLEANPEQRGEPLGARAGGNLTGLRKLVVGDRAYRIIFEVRADGSVVVVWIIGKRANDEVYDLARARVETYTADPQKRAALQTLLNIV